jgi:hypothetical protein
MTKRTPLKFYIVQGIHIPFLLLYFNLNPLLRYMAHTFVVVHDDDDDDTFGVVHFVVSVESW